MTTPDPSSAPGVPVCYRHPDRETYIRCGRCDRPICPDCMTSAAVGFHCPECMAEAKASARPVKSRLGATVPSRPTVTIAIIALCVVAYGWQFLTQDAATGDYGMWPVYVSLGDQYYRLLTSMFLHGSLLHIGLNMLFLWMLGPQLEYVLGHVRFAVLYVVAGLGGSIASFWFSAPNTLSVGASGAIFGLLGAYVVVGRRLNFDTTQIIGLIGINIVLGFVISGIDWRAHLGGLVTGAVVAAVFAYAPARGRIAVQVGGVLAVVALLAVVTVVRDQQLTNQLVQAGLDQISGG